MTEQEKLDEMHSGRGFIAALDQSGGSTPKALKLYGIDESEYSNDDEMFALIHQMRVRVISSPAFSSANILGAILFEKTLDGQVDGVATAQYLLDKGILPFLKIDAGLDEKIDDVQLMKPIPRLDELLEKAVKSQTFGTKMRSLISGANVDGIRKVVAQQFELAEKILAAGLIPIVEPEVDINIPDKAAAEEILKNELKNALAELSPEKKVILKLTLPDRDGFYSEFLDDPKVLRVVALSGGYSRDVANEKLSRNPGLVASFSRALLDGLSVDQTDDEFNAVLEKSIESIATASNA